VTDVDRAVRRVRTHAAVLLSRRLLRVAVMFPLGSRPARRLERLARRADVMLREGTTTARHASWSRGVDLDALDDEAQAVAAGFVPTVHRLPLVLVTQAPRSGGTLLLRLFDGHRSCLTIPHELGRMLPAGSLPREPRAAFDALTPKPVYKWHESGVEIGWSRLAGPRMHRYEFRLPPPLLLRLFADLAERSPVHSDRELLDAYFTAYFNAWLEGPGLDAERTWLVGFEPGGIAKPGRMERFDENYPDGRVISVVRDPWSWLVSARRWNRRLTHPKVALRLWLQATEAALAYRRRQPQRLLVVSFDDLLIRTRGTMESVARFLRIPFAEALLAPTFAGRPTDSNSSFPGLSAGVSAAPVVDRRSELGVRDERAVDRLAGRTWERVLELVEAEARAA
jgi:Sulfotransferase family